MGGRLDELDSDRAMTRCLPLLILLAALLARGGTPPPALPALPVVPKKYSGAVMTKGAASLTFHTAAVVVIPPTATVTVTMSPPAQLEISTDLVNWFPVGMPTNVMTLPRTNSQAFMQAAAVVPLAWQPSDSPTVAGYYVYEYWLPTANTMLWQRCDVGNVTNALIEAMTSGTNYFRASAYDAAGNESQMTDAVGVVPAVPQIFITTP